MKETVKSSSGVLSLLLRIHRSRRLYPSLLGIGFCFLPFALAAAHEPITTKVRFNKEVIRVLQRSCLGCHRTGGAAMSLATYEEARPWAKAIKEELLEKRMPPWHAVKGYGDFRNAPRLTQRDIDLIVNWVEGGAPKGDDKDLPPGPLISTDWQLGNPDLILKPQRESKIAADADEYRIFLIATNLKEDKALTAIDLQPGNGAVVHCAKIYYLKSAESTGEPMVPIKPEETAPDLRFASVLATWMPGQRTVALSDGVAQILPAGARLAVKIHYRGSGEEGSDLSAVGLYFAKAAPRSMIQEIPISSADVLIPVTRGAEPIRLSYASQSDTEAIGIRPRVSPLIVSLQATVYRPDGSEEVLIWTRGYHFDWEPTYFFRQPVLLPKGARIDVVAYFDNSEENPKNPNDPPKQLRWSEVSTDPLCALLVTRSIATVNSQNSR